MEVGRQLFDQLRQTDPAWPGVSDPGSASWKKLVGRGAFGRATRPFAPRHSEMLNREKFALLLARATAILASLTFSRSFLVRTAATTEPIPVTRRGGLRNMDVTVIRITAEAVATSGQFPCEVRSSTRVCEGAEQEAERLAASPSSTGPAQTVLPSQPGIEERPG